MYVYNSVLRLLMILQVPRHLSFQFGSDSDIEPIAEFSNEPCKLILFVVYKPFYCTESRLSLTGDVPKTSPQTLPYVRTILLHCLFIAYGFIERVRLASDQNLLRWYVLADSNKQERSIVS